MSPNLGSPYGRQTPPPGMPQLRSAKRDVQPDEKDGEALWEAPYEGPAPKLLFVAPDGDIYELDKGMLPRQFQDVAILSGFISAISQRITEQWVHG